MAMMDVTNDPDRVTYPLKRTGGPGEFTRVSWDEALNDIAARLNGIRSEYGDSAVASYLGNPSAYATNAFAGFGGLLAKMGSYKAYGAGSQDSNARLTANYILYGDPMLLGVTDFVNCDFLIIVGANPLVSNGWMMYMPRIRHDLDEIAERGRVVVIDPRRSETAQRFEHLSVRAESDVWLLLGVLRVLIDEHRIDEDALEKNAVGWSDLKSRIANVTLDDAAKLTGLPEETITALAREFATSRRASIYGGLGICRGEFGTLGAFLLSALNVVTGRYGAEGGTLFGRPVLGIHKPAVGGHGEYVTRVGGVPTIAGYMATAMLPDDIEQEGEGQVRALLVMSGNPILTAPGGGRLERAIEKLDLTVSFDIYQTETNRYADYILPTTTFFERADWPALGMHTMLRPFLQYTDPVIAPIGEAREESEIFTDLARRMGLNDSCSGSSVANEEMDTVARIDAALRLGPVGDQFGKREGWSRDRLRAYPHGVIVNEMPDGAVGWKERIAYPDGRIRLWHDLIAPEFDRLFERDFDMSQLRLIGRRDIRSINSWMHNIDRLVRSQQPALLIHPDDAAARDLKTGDVARVASAHGSITIPINVSDEIDAGTVCYPHGWGHAAGWERANRTEGLNINLLLGLGTDAVEFVSGMTFIDCLEVSVEHAEPMAASNQPMA